jgi:hypothetical protein
MDNTSNIHNIIDKYKAGQRYFINLDFDKGEKLVGFTLTNIIFDNCCFSVDFSNTDFSNSKFINCNLKGCDFINCNLTNSTFDKCSLEGASFKAAIIKNTSLTNCYCYGQPVQLDKSTGELERYKDPFVKELYDNVPEFNEMTDHTTDDLPYIVYGELSWKLFEEITGNNTTTDFTKKCFLFFNKIGSKNDNNIDNLLVVGIYEGLYANKKCNDIARQYLTGRNKDVYEHGMINGNIRANY